MLNYHSFFLARLHPRPTNPWGQSTCFLSDWHIGKTLKNTEFELMNKWKSEENKTGTKAAVLVWDLEGSCSAQMKEKVRWCRGKQEDCGCTQQANREQDKGAAGAFCKEYSVTGRVGRGKGWRIPRASKVCRLFELSRDDQALSDVAHFASGSRPVLARVSV